MICQYFHRTLPPVSGTNHIFSTQAIQFRLWGETLRRVNESVHQKVMIFFLIQFFLKNCITPWNENIWNICWKYLKIFREKFSENFKEEFSFISLFTREESSLVGGFLGIHAATMAYIPNMYIWAGTGRYSLGQDTLSYQRATKMQRASGIAVEQEL